MRAWLRVVGFLLLVTSCSTGGHHTSTSDAVEPEPDVMIEDAVRSDVPVHASMDATTDVPRDAPATSHPDGMMPMPCDGTQSTMVCSRCMDGPGISRCVGGFWTPCDCTAVHADAA